MLFSSVRFSQTHLYFTVERLGALFPQLNFNEDRLREELIEYQITDSVQLPQEDKIDRFWGLVGNDVRFSELPRLMKAPLCIPHSNASSEKVFSIVTTASFSRHSAPVQNKHASVKYLSAEQDFYRK